jgi:hypothetical protein
MSLISRLERRFGWLAVPNLTIVLIAGQVALYVAARVAPQGVSIERVMLDPQRVVDGEVWRIVTFLFTPPRDKSIFVIFYFLLLYLFGTTLEHHWGEFRYNLFIFIGYAANVAAAFIAWGVFNRTPELAAVAGQLGSTVASNYFLYGSLFLAFARLYPDFIINLFFILPIRIKWLALLAWLGYAYTFLVGGGMERMLVVANVLNYILFFGREHWREFRHGHRRRSFQAKAKKATAAPKHACRVCGLNSDESPKTLFRYCSKCAGQACYCPDHIRDHEHINAEEPAAS